MQDNQGLLSTWATRFWRYLKVDFPGPFLIVFILFNLTLAYIHYIGVL